MQDFFSLSLSFLFSSYDKFYSFSSLILHIRFSDDDLFWPRCLNVTEKVSNHIQRLHFEWIKNAKNRQFGQFLKTWSLLSNSVTSQFYKDKYWWKCQNWKVQMRLFRVILKQCEVFQPRNHWRKNLARMRSKRENALITATKQLCVVTFELSEHSRNALQGVLAHHHYCNHRHHPFKMLTERNKSNLDFPFSHSVTFMVRKQYDQNNHFGIFRYAGIFRF